VTLSVAILVSLVVSLTTTPMLSAKFLEPHNKRNTGASIVGERLLWSGWQQNTRAGSAGFWDTRSWC